jgi:trehalose 6-phosphate synthase/phosphatase
MLLPTITVCPERRRTSNAKGRLIVVSNRLPVCVTEDDGRWSMRASAGGLATGIQSYLQQRKVKAPGVLAATSQFVGSLLVQHVWTDPDEEDTESLWIGWPGAAVPAQEQPYIRKRLMQNFQASPVFLTAEETRPFYDGFCNNTLWPLFHYFSVYTDFSPENWEAYVYANERFCDAVVEAYQPGDVIWVHDYHLMLLPQLLRERLPEARIGFFLHIPFPSFEIFRLLPREWSTALLEGVLGADQIGFHTHDYAQHFLRSVMRLIGIEHELGTIEHEGRVLKVDTFPMGIEFNRYSEAPISKEGMREWEDLRRLLDDRKAILSVDRLDYTKGILNRLEAFDLFLSQHPEWHGRAVLLAIVVPSRENVATYDVMKRKIDEAIGAINGKYGRLGWTPVIYQYRNLSLAPLAAAYAASDVCLVTPLRDGMNLVAKEYVASSVDERGVLILSEMAGAATELGEAIIVNPNSRDEIAAAICTALEMAPDEQKRRMRAMRDRVCRYDVTRWAEDFLSGLDRVWQTKRSFEEIMITGSRRESMVKEFAKARRRLILTDYDGTLTGFHRDPLKARPSARILDLLRRLAADQANSVALVSGRMQEILLEWFGDLEIGLAAEHGAFVREARAKSDNWRQLAMVKVEWKEQVRPIIQAAADRLPGSFIEEKHLSIGWHWRGADPDLGRQRALELSDRLTQLTANRDLQVLQGNKVVELRCGNVNKGVAGLHFLRRYKPDFVLALGDDWTDEDLFKAMPSSAYTVKVGQGRSSARYALNGPDEVLELLETLARLQLEPANAKAHARIPLLTKKWA